MREKTLTREEMNEYGRMCRTTQNLQEANINLGWAFRQLATGQLKDAGNSIDRAIIELQETQKRIRGRDNIVFLPEKLGADSDTSNR